MAGAAQTTGGWWRAAVMVILLAVAVAWLADRPGVVIHRVDQGEAPSAQERVEGLLEDAEYDGKTGTGIDQYVKSGGETAAGEDFEDLAEGLQVEEDPDEGARWVRFEDGTTITRYPSKGGDPSIEVNKSPTIPRTKIRYR